MATIHDVARVAGVSISTVSYALSGKRSIGPAVRARVDSAVAELGYQANAGARMLAGTQTNILALSAPMHAETHPPAFMSFVVSIATAAREVDYDLLLLTETEPLAGLRRVASSKLVDGIVVMDVSTDDPRVPLLRDLRLPSAIIGVPDDVDGMTCVDFDFEAAADLAVERLAALGHREIGLLGHSAALYERGSNFAPRFRDAFLASAAARGVKALFTMSDLGSRADVVGEMRRELPGMTALVLNCNEEEHRRVLHSLERDDVTIPSDLAVVSACSSFSTDNFTTALDVIPLPAEKSGRRAVELTMAQLRGDSEAHVELIPPEYVAKGSTVSV
ncbi:LacI family transcriptional regulator [Frondihabitans sucicola]|uniref:LacI family transcriptional regulator n=1 Tax=Frondihabitans sucicola TaxID=1268041 RepID=A0ABN6XX45_9MICO|nr:LacI family DNA-binding transcriptional regulator [Frondihabitans sucicola]BDZ49612.1 LacI family transcriptional regulator [Frondihabitans sucicola]